MKRHVSFILAVAIVLLSPIAFGDQVIDPLDDESPYNFIENQENVIAYAWDTADFAPGSVASLRMEYQDLAGNGWGQVQGQYSTPLDLSAETTIRFWAKGSVNGMEMNLTFAVPDWQPGGSWVTNIGPMTTEWAQYEVPIADFEVNPYYVDQTTPVDWSNVGTFQIAPTGGTYGTFWIDQLEAFGSVGIGVTQVVPSKGANVPNLPQISVAFSKSVTGVDAADLTVNGSPAVSVSGSGMGPYVFTGFAQPAIGTANIALASGGITDGVDVFPGDSWTYQIEEWMLAIAPFAITPITLDGTLDPAEWTDANSYYFDGTDNTARPGWANPAEITADDWACTFSVKHDTDYIYVGVYIYDDVLIADGPNTPDYRDDRMEMYFDPDNSDSSNITNSPFGFQMAYDGRNYAAGAGFQQWWWAAATSDTVHVTTYEFQIAKEVTDGVDTVNMVTGGTYGFDLSPDDQDDPTTDAVRDTQIWWNAQTDSAWNNEPPWGDIFLDPNPLTFPMPGQVQNLQGVGADQYALLSWDPVSFATEYRVYQGDTTGGPYTMVTTSTATTDVRVDGLVNGSTYYFVVAAANPTGEGPQSAELELLITGQSLRARSWQEYR